ncbi:MAG: 50S ribosome-binding GTPase [Candidatus Aegiribacteria sp.]|nr:50S ribosome-binding GTPase [Candidatus Aegiribacteria sp.]
MKSDSEIKAGYVAIAGLTNSGKSTLINTLTERKISPSHVHKGTTRVPISSIYMNDDSQICFIDTPPIEVFDDAVFFSGMDVICLTINSTDLSSQLKSNRVREFIDEIAPIPLIIAPTFIDCFPRYLHSAFINQIAMFGSFQEIVPVCSPCLESAYRLRKVIAGYIPDRGRLFPEGCTSLHSERFLVSEQIRISLFSVLPSDVANTTAVQIEEFSIRDEKRYVRANLHVAKHSNKGVVIGRKGAMLQNIADIAAEGASKILERPMYLDLWVKVRESWPGNQSDLVEFGYVC